MREALGNFVNRVKELAEHVRGNEQATKQSLIGPLFTLLGYDLTDPRQCIPEYRVDFGKDRSVKPIDWAFIQNGRPLFFIEAKEAGRKLAGFDEQLADYFAKAPEAKLGILTNGVQWRFFTDLEHANVMDKEPFVKWDVLNDEHPPVDFLTILQKSEFNPGLLRTFAQRSMQRNLLVGELSRLLEPAAEFTKLVIANIETRNLTAAVVETWKPVVASAISEWAKQRALSSVIDSQVKQAPSASQPAQPVAAEDTKIETTQEEKDTFALIQKLLGADRPVAYEDTASYFKIHLPERRTWVVCRLLLGRKRPAFWVPLAAEQLSNLPSNASVSTPTAGWSAIAIDSGMDIARFASVLQAAWDSVRTGKSKSSE